MLKFCSIIFYLYIFAEDQWRCHLLNSFILLWEVIYGLAGRPLHIKHKEHCHRQDFVKPLVKRMKSSTRGTERRSADLPENNTAASQPCLITCGLEGLVSPEMWFFLSFLAPKEKQTEETGVFWNCTLLKTTLMGIFVVSWLSCSFRIIEPQLLSIPRVVKSTWRL